MPVVAVPDLAIVAAAVVALLLLLALFLFERLLSESIGRAPFIGGWISSTLSSAMRWTRDAMGSVLDGAMHGLTDSFHAAIAFLENLYDIAHDAVSAAVSASHRMATVWIPDWIHWVERSAAKALAAADATLSNWIRYAVAHAEAARAAITAEFTQWDQYLHDLAVSLFNSAIAELSKAVTALDKGISTAEAEAKAEVSTALALAESDIAAALHLAQTQALQLFQTAEADAATAFAKAEVYAKGRADQALQDAVKAIDGAAAASVGALWHGIVTDVDGLENVIGNDLPAIRDLVDAIPRAIPGDLASALAGIAAIAIPMLRFMEDCGIPNCKNLGGLGKFLENLFAGATDTALIALFIAMVSDPAGAADDVETILGPIIATAQDAGKTLLGLG